MQYKLTRQAFGKVCLAEESESGMTLDELIRRYGKGHAVRDFFGDVARTIGRVGKPALPVIAAAGIVLSGCEDKNNPVFIMPDVPSGFIEPTDIVDNPTTGVPQAQNELIVPFELGIDEDTINQIVLGCGGNIVGYDAESNIVQIRTSGSLADLESSLLSHPEVISAPPNVVFGNAADLPNDPYWGSPGTWGFEVNGFTPVWQNYGIGNEIVFVFDGRFNPDHEDLNDNVLSHSRINGSLWNKKQDYHGNMSAGLVAAVYNNTLGISGSGNKVRLRGVYGLISEFVSRAKEASEEDGNEAKIILIGRALNWPSPVPGNADSTITKLHPVLERILTVYGKNTLFIMPAGNNGIESKYGTGFLDEARPWNMVVVGAHEQAYDPSPPDRRRLPSSNYGCDVYAAGEVMTSLNEDDYEMCEGTCVSAALIANAAGLIKSYYKQITGRDITARQIKELLLAYHGAVVPEWLIMKEPPLLQINSSFVNIEDPYSGVDVDADGWVTEALVESNVPGIISSRLSGFASNGVEHLVFETEDAGVEHIWHLSYDGSTSTLEEVVSDCSSPVGAIDKDDNLHVVYENSGQIVHKIKDSGTGTWGAEQVLGDGSRPRIAVYKDKVHAVFASGNKVVYGCFEGSDWKFADVAKDVPNANPKIAVDEFEGVHVIWKENNDVYVRTRVGKSWKLKKNVSNTPLTTPEYIAIGCNDVMKDRAIFWSESEAGVYGIHEARDSYLSKTDEFDVKKLADAKDDDFVVVRDKDGRCRLCYEGAAGRVMLVDMGGVNLQKDGESGVFIIRQYNHGKTTFANTTVSYRTEDSGGKVNIHRIHKIDR